MVSILNCLARSGSAAIDSTVSLTFNPNRSASCATSASVCFICSEDAFVNLNASPKNFATTSCCKPNALEACAISPTISAVINLELFKDEFKVSAIAKASSAEIVAPRLRAADRNSEILVRNPNDLIDLFLAAFDATKVSNIRVTILTTANTAVNLAPNCITVLRMFFSVPLIPLKTEPNLSNNGFALSFNAGINLSFTTRLKSLAPILIRAAASLKSRTLRRRPPKAFVNDFKDSLETSF